MRAETVIATHGNTDFDAFAALLAARRLYPDAVACLTGSLNRNVREFYRLHADELALVEASRLEVDAIRRLIVVETTHAARLGELEAVALDENVEKVVFDHHAGELPDWAGPEHTVVSEDGALTTTLVGILAEREVAFTPLEATAFALGIHEDTGSLTYPTATQRDARGRCGGDRGAPRGRRTPASRFRDLQGEPRRGALGPPRRARAGCPRAGARRAADVEPGPHRRAGRDGRASARRVPALRAE